MKTTLLITSIFVLTISTLQAQTIAKKNELGTKLFSYTITPDIFYAADGDFHFVNGMQYKRVLPKQFAFRAQFDIRNRQRSDYSIFTGQTNIVYTGPRPTYYEVKTQWIDLFVGMEKRWTIKKLAPYIYTDIRGVNESAEARTNEDGSEATRTFNQFSLGVCTGGGLMYNLGSSLYVSVEGGLSFDLFSFRKWKSNNLREPFYYHPVNALTFGVRF